MSTEGERILFRRITQPGCDGNIRLTDKFRPYDLPVCIGMEHPMWRLFTRIRQYEDLLERTRRVPLETNATATPDTNGSDSEERRGIMSEDTNRIYHVHIREEYRNKIDITLPDGTIMHPDKNLCICSCKAKSAGDALCFAAGKTGYPDSMLEAIPAEAAVDDGAHRVQAMKDYIMEVADMPKKTRSAICDALSGITFLLEQHHYRNTSEKTKLLNIKSELTAELSSITDGNPQEYTSCPENGTIDLHASCSPSQYRGNPERIYRSHPYWPAMHALSEYEYAYRHGRYYLLENKNRATRILHVGNYDRDFEDTLNRVLDEHPDTISADLICEKLREHGYHVVMPDATRMAI